MILLWCTNISNAYKCSKISGNIFSCRVKRNVANFNASFKRCWSSHKQCSGRCHTEWLGKVLKTRTGYWRENASPWWGDRCITSNYFIDRQKWQLGFGYCQFRQRLKLVQCTSCMSDHVCVCVQTLVSWLLPCQNVLKQAFPLVSAEGAIHANCRSKRVRE